jgi:hypothetical protein
VGLVHADATGHDPVGLLRDRRVQALPHHRRHRGGKAGLITVESRYWRTTPHDLVLYIFSFKAAKENTIPGMVEFKHYRTTGATVEVTLPKKGVLTQYEHHQTLILEPNPEPISSLRVCRRRLLKVRATCARSRV